MSHEASSIPDFIRPVGGLIVGKLDRLGGNTRDVLNLVHELEEKGASLRVLEPAIDTGGPMGHVVLTVLGMLAEMELGIRYGNAPTWRPRSRRGLKGPPGHFRPSAHCHPAQGRDAPALQATASAQPRAAPPHL
jgi:hypothetical protein